MKKEKALNLTKWSLKLFYVFMAGIVLVVLGLVAVVILVMMGTMTRGSDGSLPITGPVSTALTVVIILTLASLVLYYIVYILLIFEVKKDKEKYSFSTLLIGLIPIVNLFALYKLKRELQ